TLLEALLKDPGFKFVDNINTPEPESLQDVVTAAFKKAAVAIAGIESRGSLEWAAYKQTQVKHLLNLPALSRLNLPIGGGTHVINAANSQHGPSWRMVVSLSSQTKAYGIYPGGQSGNPGSRFYDSFVDSWAQGKFYSLWMMKADQTRDTRIKWTMSFKPA